MRLPSNFLRPSLPSFKTPHLTSHQLVADIFQRIPPASQLLVLVIAIWGPRHAPLLFSIMIILVHGTFVASNARTAYGMRYACKATLECASKDWRAESSSPEEFDRVKHLIILPHYKETLDTLRETLSVLASHPNAHKAYRICLASEEAEAAVEEKVRGLIEEYCVAFFDIQFTLHPRGIEGEAAGKSSNVAWAAKEMHLRDSQYAFNQIITVMDADSCFASDFFSAAASKFVSASHDVRRSMMFVAPIFFDRNASDVASPVVVTDILWCAAGLGTMYPGSLAKLPTSAYAMTNELAARIGFWDAGPEAIGEDLHMSVKAFFETAGDLHVEAIFSPASQCNIVGFRYPRVNGASPTYPQQVYEWISDLLARYTQAKRHMWGALDSGYALRRLALNRFGVGTDSPTKRTANDIELENGLRAVSLRLDANSIRFNRTGPFSPPLSPTSVPTPSSEQSEQSEISDYTFSDSDAASSNSSPPSSNAASPLLRGLDLKTDSSIAPISLSEHSFAPLSAPANMSNVATPVPMFNLFILMSRLFEAHFNLGFLFMFLSVAPYFNPGLEPMPLWKLRAGAGVVGEAGLLPKAVLYATAISSHLGTVAFICTALIFFYYEQFHHIATTKRWENQTHLGARAHQQTTRSLPWCAVTYASLPFTLLFGIIPLYHAQFCHIFSNRLTYQVSAKPTALVASGRYTPLPTTNSDDAIRV